MLYCISDIHGEYGRYLKLLEKISFSACDTLYFLGDALDRGPEPMEVLLDMMGRPNVIPFIGNHDFMALNCLRFLSAESSRGNTGALCDSDLVHWWNQGGLPTMEGFLRLPEEKKRAVLAYLEGFRHYGELSVGGREYILVHGGLGNFSPEKHLTDYTIEELVWDRLEYGCVYFPDKYLVSGHTPTRYIRVNPRPDHIYQGRRHIAIDCGSVYGGLLGAICLDTGEEFYV